MGIESGSLRYAPCAMRPTTGTADRGKSRFFVAALLRMTPPGFPDHANYTAHLPALQFSKKCFMILRSPAEDENGTSPALPQQDCHPEPFGHAQDKLREGSALRF